MKLTWLVQDIGMVISQLHRKFDALEFMSEKIANVGVAEDYPYITGLEEAVNTDLTTRYVFLGGVKILNLLRKATHISDVMADPSDFHRANSDCILSSLRAGYFYDVKTFDQAYYSNLKLPLLNNNAQYLALEDNLDTVFDVDKFIKPSRDLKAFNAGIIPTGKSIGEFVLNQKRQRFFMEEQVVIADTVEINDEYRFFVINDEVVTGSAYRQNGAVKEGMHVPDRIYAYARRYAQLYRPATVFTMDLATLTNGDVRIVEYNCFNCSGVYLCDLVATYNKIKIMLYKQVS
jgi:hypothetical protein